MILDGTYGNGWRYEYGVFADRANDNGVDASQICCECTTANLVYTGYHCSLNLDTTPVQTKSVPKLGDVAWRDAGGHSCHDYTDRQWCTGGTFGEGWDTDWGTFSQFANDDDVDAREACCACMEPDSPKYTEMCLQVVDGQSYKIQHIFSIILFLVAALIVLILEIINGVRRVRKKKVFFLRDLTLLALVGSFLFLLAKAGVYWGSYLSIWSESEEMKSLGVFLVDTVSK